MTHLILLLINRRCVAIPNSVSKRSDLAFFFFLIIIVQLLNICKDSFYLLLQFYIVFARVCYKPLCLSTTTVSDNRMWSALKKKVLIFSLTKRQKCLNCLYRLFPFPYLYLTSMALVIFELFAHESDKSSHKLWSRSNYL